ncbi:MAG: flagellar basal body P-ring formation chaperone FlgA [Deltaproteobacteria bacterium]|jgi:flagella basal body P-ring formation protein FlgA|nr:flagellar basal body P-ring formation chaperone FlgA [Deltaproteobacteria bacterium]
MTPNSVPKAARPRPKAGWLLLLALAPLVALLCLPPGLFAGVSVIVPSENTVVGQRILLGDIATIGQDSELDKELAELLGKADLGPSPLPGQRLTLRRQQFESRLISSGAPVNDARWLIPDTVTLIGTGQDTDPSEVRRIVNEYLARTEPYASGRYEILSVNSASPPSLPPGAVEYRFSAQPSSNPNYLAGTIFFMVDGTEAGRLRVTAQIDLQVAALLAARDLPRGHILSEEDLTEGLAPFTKAKGALTQVSQATGQTLKVSIRAGNPVHDRDLERTFMVTKGETVTIIAQSGGLKVTALGEARENGALGQTISVINLDSKKSVSGRVIGPGQVEVMF